MIAFTSTKLKIERRILYKSSLYRCDFSWLNFSQWMSPIHILKTEACFLKVEWFWFSFLFFCTIGAEKQMSYDVKECRICIGYAPSNSFLSTLPRKPQHSFASPRMDIGIDQSASVSPFNGGTNRLWRVWTFHGRQCRKLYTCSRPLLILTVNNGAICRLDSWRLSRLLLFQKAINMWGSKRNSIRSRLAMLGNRPDLILICKNILWILSL